MPLSSPKRNLSNQSEKAKKYREGKHNEPDNVDKKEGLAGATIADLAESQLGDLDAGAEGVGAAAPIGDAVDAADGVGPEAVDGAGRGHGSFSSSSSSSSAAEIGGVFGV